MLRRDRDATRCSWRRAEPSAHAWTGTTTTATTPTRRVMLPLLQPAQGHFFDGAADGLPGDHRRDGRARRIPTARSWRRVSKASPLSYLRISTDDLTGKMRGYVGEGEFTTDPLETFGGYGVVQIPTSSSCCATSARTASSITSPSTRPASRECWMRPCANT